MCVNMFSWKLRISKLEIRHDYKQIELVYESGVE